MTNFCNYNAIFLLRENQEAFNHEYGVGGSRTDRLRISDNTGNDYLEVRIEREWITTSDDFVHYGGPINVEISGARPLMDETVADCLSIIDSPTA